MEEGALRTHHDACAALAASKRVVLLSHARRPDRAPGQETLTGVVLSGLPEAADWPCWPAELTQVHPAGSQVAHHLVSAQKVARHLVERGHAAVWHQRAALGQLVVCGYAAAKVSALLELKAPRVPHPCRWHVRASRDRVYAVLAAAHCSGGASSSAGWDVTREAFEEIWKRASWVRNATLGPERCRSKAIAVSHAARDPTERSAVAKRFATLGPEGLAARGKKIGNTAWTKTPEERSKHCCRRANTTLGPKGSRERIAKALATLGPNGRRERAARILENMGEEGLKRRNQKIAAGHAARDPQERSAAARRSVETLGVEGCKERTAKAFRTMGPDGLRRRAARILESLGEEGLRKRNEAIGMANKAAYERKLIEKYGSVEAGRMAQKAAARERTNARIRQRRAERSLWQTDGQCVVAVWSGKKKERQRSQVHLPPPLLIYLAADIVRISPSGSSNICLATLAVLEHKRF